MPLIPEGAANRHWKTHLSATAQNISQPNSYHAGVFHYAPTMIELYPNNRGGSGKTRLVTITIQ